MTATTRTHGKHSICGAEKSRYEKCRVVFTFRVLAQQPDHVGEHVDRHARDWVGLYIGRLVNWRVVFLREIVKVTIW